MHSGLIAPHDWDTDEKRLVAAHARLDEEVLRLSPYPDIGCMRPTPVRSRALHTMLLVWLIAAVAITLYYALFAHAHSSLLASLFDRPDVVFHLVAFVAMALPAFLLWGSMWKVVMGLVALAGAIELLQMTLRDREASFADLGAGSAGIVLGSLAAILVSYLGLRHSGALTKVD